MTSVITRKVSNLIQVIDDLRHQVRVALATELSQAIATTVREILDVIISGRSLATWQTSTSETVPVPVVPDDWDDPFDGKPAHRFTESQQAVIEPPSSSSEVKSSPMVTATTLSMAMNAGQWCYRQSRSVSCGFLATIAVGFASIYGGPMTRSVLAVLASVQQLIGQSDSTLSPSR